MSRMISSFNESANSTQSVSMDDTAVCRCSKKENVVLLFGIILELIKNGSRRDRCINCDRRFSFPSSTTTISEHLKSHGYLQEQRSMMRSCMLTDGGISDILDT